MILERKLGPNKLGHQPTLLTHKNLHTFQKYFHSGQERQTDGLWLKVVFKPTCFILKVKVKPSLDTLLLSINSNYD
jgi:hypothetical protein